MTGPGTLRFLSDGLGVVSCVRRGNAEVEGEGGEERRGEGVVLSDGVPDKTRQDRGREETERW